jgi:hypothetical protein
VLLITKLVPATSLFDVVDAIDRDRAGRQLASFLTALHPAATRQRAEAVIGSLAQGSGRGGRQLRAGALEIA